MSDILNAPTSGIRSERQSIDDPNELPVLRQRVSIVDAIQNAVSPVPPPVEPLHAQEPSAPQPPDYTSMPAPQATMPPTQPAPQHAVPVPGAPPALPSDSPRVQDRINRLYAQRQQANEEVLALRDRIAQQDSRIDALLRSAPVQQSSPLGPSSDVPPPAGQFISRAELLDILRQERQANSQESAIRSAHVVSRIEAERDFPDVFQDPELRVSAEQIWAADRLLQSDPHGPYKAAALARGLRPGQAQQATAGVPADVRKALMSTGSSVIESSAGQPSQAQRYDAALRRARATQDPADFIVAQRIAQGLA